MNPISFGIGTACGMAAMYILDPERGHRRRALARDQIVHLQHEGSVFLRKAAVDLKNRARGTVAETRATLKRETVGDDVLEARVRTEMGRVASHPGAIDVDCRDGFVRVMGQAPEDEADRILACARSVRGVQGIEDELRRRSMPTRIPSLQGLGKLPSRMRMKPAAELIVMMTTGFIGMVGLPAVLVGMRAIRTRRIARGEPAQVIRPTHWNINQHPGESAMSA